MMWFVRGVLQDPSVFARKAREPIGAITAQGNNRKLQRVVSVVPPQRSERVPPLVHPPSRLRQTAAASRGAGRNVMAGRLCPCPRRQPRDRWGERGPRARRSARAVKPAPKQGGAR